MRFLSRKVRPILVNLRSSVHDVLEEATKWALKALELPVYEELVDDEGRAGQPNNMEVKERLRPCWLIFTHGGPRSRNNRNIWLKPKDTAR